MNKAEIESRLVELNSALEQSRAHFNALIGRIDECKYLLTLCPEPAKDETIVEPETVKVE